MKSSGQSLTECRRDAQGRVWELLHGPFLRFDDTMVVQATLGWEQGDQVRRDLHIPLEDWQSWEVVG